MIGVWVYTVICIGSLWCVPEHDRRSMQTYSTKEDCLQAGRKKHDYVLKRGWVINCTEFYRVPAP